MRALIDLDRYPLDQPDGLACQALIGACREALARDGLFNLPGFVRSEALAGAVEELRAELATNAFTHARRHNIYFKDEVDGLAPDHPALQRFETANRTICADQMADTSLIRLYEWPPFADFLAAVLDKPALYTMADPLARVNVMAYGAGQTLNWHFDRSEFTTTLLLQAPVSGGRFEYARDLRGEDDPNYDGVADLLEGRLAPAYLDLAPGTLNVFKGKNTAHRVTSVHGSKDRIIAVFSYYQKPEVAFSREERLGFYGRAD